MTKVYFFPPPPNDDNVNKPSRVQRLQQQLPTNARKSGWGGVVKENDYEIKNTRESVRRKARPKKKRKQTEKRRQDEKKTTRGHEKIGGQGEKG